MSTASVPRLTFRIVEQIDGAPKVSEEVLQLGVIKIGKISSAHIRLDESSGASRMHAVMEATADEITIIDLGSTRGTQVNGKTVNKAMLWDGDTLGIGTASIEVRFETPAFRSYVATDATESALIDAIRHRPDDPGTREVYADWLEQVGRAAYAAYLRFEIDPSATAFRELHASMLQDRDAAGWRAIVSRLPIDGCAVATCPARWEALESTGADDLRRCSTCSSNVHFCATTMRTAYFGRTRERVAIDRAVQRDGAMRAYERAVR